MSYYSVRVVKYMVPYTRTRWQAVAEWRVQVQKGLYNSNINTCECCALAELGFLVRRWLLHVRHAYVLEEAPPQECSGATQFGSGPA
jgi:hypothetical protein